MIARRLAETLNVLMVENAEPVRKQDVQRQPQHFVRRVAEDALCTIVEQHIRCDSSTETIASSARSRMPASSSVPTSAAGSRIARSRRRAPSR